MKSIAGTVTFVWAVFAATLVPAGIAHADKIVDGMKVYYGIVPAGIVARSAESHDPNMHGRKRLSKGSHHLVVTLVDDSSGQRIEDATVSASVTPLGSASQEKVLESMSINDTTSYGNFFDIPAGSTPVRIVLKIKRGGSPSRAESSVEFSYRPPGR